MSPIRLAYILSRMEPGGAELQAISLIGYLTGQGYEVDVVCRAGTGSLDEAVRAAGARLRVTADRSSASTPRHVALRRRLARPLRWASLARGRYDIADAWLYPSDVEAAITRPVTRTPVVMSARLGRSPRDHFGRASGLMDALSQRLTDLVVANSDISAADAIRGGVPAERVRVIRGGVRMPPTISDEERRRVRTELGVGDEHLLIGNVGNFRSMKRQDLLIDAFSRLLPGHPDLRLVLAGDGDLRPGIEDQVRGLGLEDRVVLAGTVADMPPLYAALDLFVQASNSEGLPNVLLEAAASHLPIVATAAGGSGEVIKDGQTGLLVPIDDLEALTAAMGTAIEDLELRRRLGAAARIAIERDYGMERFYHEYDATYRELLAAKGHVTG